MRSPVLSSSPHVLLATLLALGVAVAWDASGLDLWLAHLAGGSVGFPLKNEWFLSQLLHEGAPYAAWLGAVALALSVGWPWGPMAGVPRGRRLQWAVSALAAVGLVSVLKAASATSCPWDLQEFGGLAQHISHWSHAADGGPGRCFPAGHASSGFAFLGGFFALRGTHPRAARRVLEGSLAVGTLLGLAQQWRGAHFMSHTLWTGWLCWASAWLLDIGVHWEHAG
jgi:membrane-associated PAP2 superfamily phosphatase